MKIPVSISNRHIHLSQKDADSLFGTNYQFTVLKNLSQPGQFAYQEVVTISWPKWSIEGVRVLWPCRKDTQIEILMGDNFSLGIQAPLRLSWDLEATPGLKITWPKWSIQTTKWTIVAQRHLHISDIKAKESGLQTWQIIKVKIDGPRWAILENIIVRTSKDFDTDLHLDREEGNACGINMQTLWEITT